MASPSNPFEPFFDEVRKIVREEIAAALGAQKQAPAKDWLKATELSKIYDLPATWFQERGRRGEIERSKPGRYVLFLRRDVERFLTERKSGGH